MAQYIVGVIVQAIGVPLWSFLNAGILLWRARKTKNWVIRYKDAYVVSLKAGFIGMVSANVAALTIATAVVALGAKMNEENLLRGIGLSFGLGAWWISHSRALVKLAGNATPLTIQDARKLSANVFAFLFGAIWILVIVILLVMGVVSTITKP